VREARPPGPVPPPPPLRWGLLPPELRRLVTAVSLLTLVAVPDAFLLLWLTQAGFAVVALPLLWTAVQAVRAAVAWPGGWAADRAGRLPVVAAGWLARAAALGVLALGPGPWGGALLLAVYAGATAATEGAERAFIGDAAPAPLAGTAFGLYHMNVGLLSLPGALWLGWAWQVLGVRTALAVSAALTLLLGLYLLRAATRARAAASP